MLSLITTRCRGPMGVPCVSSPDVSTVASQSLTVQIHRMPDVGKIFRIANPLWQSSMKKGSQISIGRCEKETAKLKCLLRHVHKKPQHFLFYFEHHSSLSKYISIYRLTTIRHIKPIFWVDFSGVKPCGGFLKTLILRFPPLHSFSSTSPSHNRGPLHGAISP